MKRILLCLLLLQPFLSLTHLQAQNVADSGFSASLIIAHYSYQFPGGDLVRRYGESSDIGGSFLFKTKNNWLTGFQGNYLFGSNVKEDDILKNISTVNNWVIDRAGTYAEIYMYERGFQLSGHAGKIISLGKSNPNSGIMLLSGLGYLQHKIRIENPNKSAPQVQGDYRRGYDRLTGGLCFSQFLGYVYFSNNKFVNFYGGIEYRLAWTKSLRDFDFDKQAKDTQARKDILWGFKIGWIIPMYQKTGQVYYYY